MHSFPLGSREILVDELQFYFEQNQAAEFEEDDINGMDSRKRQNEIFALIGEVRLA